MEPFIDTRGQAEKPSRLAILLSALVFPGVGQYLQKRLLTGSFYTSAFLCCVTLLFKIIFTPFFLNLRALEESLAGAPPVYSPAPWKNILIWTAISAFVYLANLLDVFVCYRRRLAAWRGRVS